MKIMDIKDLTNGEYEGYQLTEAVQILSKSKITQNDIFSAPFGWNESHWQQECEKSYIQRIETSSVLIDLEIIRIKETIHQGKS